MAIDATTKERKAAVKDGQFDLLAHVFRRWGFLKARLDDLDRMQPYEHADLADAARNAPPEAVEKWERIYCGSIGVEFMHMIDGERQQWVQEWMEGERAAVNQEAVLEQLMKTEVFERFLHARYVGSKRYSIEGVGGLIPLIEGILDGFVTGGGEFAVIAMSHRGRLNVLANIVGTPGAEIFAGQEDVDPKSVLGSGDVKYHLGATGVHRTTSGKDVRVHLVSNPSHLEAVDPVVMGRVRAKQDRIGAGGVDKILSLTLHGDAAFAGQGITAETLNMANLKGYTVGGTVHVIVNNLIGFTAEPQLIHSSRYASDLGRRLSIPIIHVNGEDPDAIVRAGRLAIEYKMRFHDDVIVDLVGYRRYGHSEVEDPSTTQPLLYARIKDRPMLWELYAQSLGKSKDETEAQKDVIWKRLEAEQEEGRKMTARPLMRTLPSYWHSYAGGYYNPALEAETSVPLERLREVAERMTAVPEGFSLHPKIRKLFEQRRAMVAGEHGVDFGAAECLALGSLLRDGIPVRFSGEDSRRGTFNQRNAVVIDTETGEEHEPLAALHPEQGRFNIVDSPLSEAAVLGYEYGYSRDYPDALVIWEAQFGDFVNGAQTIIDQFIAAGEDKWRLLSGLVLLLPHGFEGQGPEHSSARIERFLQLAAEDNMQIMQPSTSAQYFHLLRRQALIHWRKPMIVMTPKGLLRAPHASSPIEDFASSRNFGPIQVDNDVTNAERVIICSGKIYHELVAERERRGDERTAIISLTQLFPFPEKQFAEELRRHGSARKLVWVQEEPANMGALSYIRPILPRLVGDRHVRSVKRSPSASPATGSAKAHALEQAALIKLAFADAGL